MERKITNQTKVKIDGFDTDVIQANTDGVRIEDPGVGKPIILKHFEYRYPPGQKRPRVDELLTPSYIKHLENGLWADGMEMIAPPRVVFYRKGFRIFATCQLKRGQSLPWDRKDELKPLQDKLQGL